jgi:hypothetical protein
MAETDVDPEEYGGYANFARRLPGTEHLGIILLESVRIERKVNGVWSRIAERVPATFEPVPIPHRVKLETWTHKPLLCLWLLPQTPIQDGDRVIRDDGSRWYVRGAPLTAPARTHIVALTERATEDRLFEPLNPNEPT